MNEQKNEINDKERKKNNEWKRDKERVKEKI